MKNRKVFIGASTEAAGVADALRSMLMSSHGFECTSWRDAFPPSAFTLEALKRLATQHGFGVFIAQADDLVLRRHELAPIARDNVLHEFFLFVGENRIERTFLLVPENDRPKLPSDLDGLVWTGFDGERFKTDPTGALHGPCLKLATRMSEVAAAIEREHRLAVQRAMASTRAVQILGLYRSATALREVIDAVQRDSLAGLVDEPKFVAAKKAAILRLRELAVDPARRADDVGALAEFTSLREALIYAVDALPYPRDIARTTKEIESILQGVVSGHVVPILDAVRRHDFVSAIALGLRMKEQVNPDDIAMQAAELVTARLADLQASYSSWWAACSANVNTAITNFQSALMRAQTTFVLEAADAGPIGLLETATATAGGGDPGPRT